MEEGRNGEGDPQFRICIISPLSSLLRGWEGETTLFLFVLDDSECGWMLLSKTISGFVAFTYEEILRGESFHQVGP